jgi:hypothetical protein
MIAVLELPLRNGLRILVRLLSLKTTKLSLESFYFFLDNFEITLVNAKRDLLINLPY